MIIQIKGCELELLSEKAIYFFENDSLWLSDLHLGKAAHFRKNGIAVPSQVDNQNLDRLERLILKKQPKEVYILGDLFHSTLNRSWVKFVAWRNQFQDIPFILIEGNHDILQADLYAKANLQKVMKLELAKTFLLTHEPEETDLFNVYGHIHPCLLLRGKSKQSVRIPVFSMQENAMVLPAFGSFTGGYCLDVKKWKLFFGVVGDKVMSL